MHSSGFLISGTQNRKLDRSAISSLLADCQSLVSSRAGIRKTAFPRKISLSETLTIGPPSRKMWGWGGGGERSGRGELAFQKSAGEVLEQEHNSLSPVIRDGTQLKLRDLASTQFLAVYVRVNNFICCLAIKNALNLSLCDLSVFSCRTCAPVMWVTAGNGAKVPRAG